MHLISDVNDDLIVEPRRRAQAWGSIVSPENSNQTLFGRSRRRCENSVASDLFGFGVSGGILSAVHGGWRRNAKLAARLHDKRFAFAPMRAERDRDETDRILAPIAGHLVWKIIDAKMRLWNLRAVVRAQRENGRGRPLA